MSSFHLISVTRPVLGIASPQIFNLRELGEEIELDGSRSGGFRHVDSCDIAGSAIEGVAGDVLGDVAGHFDELQPIDSGTQGFGHAGA